MIVIVNSILLVCLFQENKSYGSKKPFALTLWYSTICVGHSKTVINFFSNFDFETGFIKFLTLELYLEFFNETDFYRNMYS